MYFDHTMRILSTVAAFTVFSGMTAVTFGLPLFQPKVGTGQQEAASQIDDGNRIQEDFRHFFESIMKKGPQETQTYHNVLEEEAAKERQAFDRMKEKLQTDNRRKFNNPVVSPDLHEVAAFKREAFDDNETTGSSTSESSEESSGSTGEDYSTSLDLQLENDTSASKTEDWSAVASTIDSRELTTDASWNEQMRTIEDIPLSGELPKNDSIFSSMDDPPRRALAAPDPAPLPESSEMPADNWPKKSTVSMLKKCWNNAGKVFDYLDHKANDANREVANWQQRLNTYNNLVFGPSGLKNLIFGPGGLNNNNNQNYGGGGGWNDYDNNNGGYGQFGNNNNNGASVLGAYESLKPYAMNVSAVLRKGLSKGLRKGSQLGRFIVDHPIVKKLKQRQDTVRQSPILRKLKQHLGTGQKDTYPKAEGPKRGRPAQKKGKAIKAKARKTRKGKGRKTRKGAARGRTMVVEFQRELSDTPAHTEHYTRQMENAPMEMADRDDYD